MAQEFETGFRTTLAAKLNASDTTITVATAPTVTMWRMHIYRWSTNAWIKYTGVTWTTLTGVTFVSQTADPTTTVTWTTFPAGTSIELVDMHDQKIDKQMWSQVKVYATTTARDADITSPSNGMTCYVTADGVFTDYIAWSWSNRATWSTANASATVAGKVEIATTAESIAGTDTWWTGALLSVLPSNIAKNIQSSTFIYWADAGGDDAYVVALTPTLTAYTTGQILTMKVTTPNTGACTVDFWPGAKSIKWADWNDPANWQVTWIVQLIYDGTNFVISTTPVDNFSLSTKATQTYHTQVADLNATMSGWTLTTTTVSSYAAGWHTVLTPSGGAAFAIETTLPWSGTTSSYSPTLSKEIRILGRMRALSLSTDRAWFWMVVDTSTNQIYTAQTDVSNSVRFINNGGVLYAHNANGTTATSTNVTGALTLANFNTYEIVFTPGTSATFYVNGTLVATHTTNLPTTGTLSLQYWTSSNGRVMHIYPPVISIQL